MGVAGGGGGGSVANTSGGLDGGAEDLLFVDMKNTSEAALEDAG